MRVLSVETTELFAGPEDAARQLVRVRYEACAEPTPVRVSGDGLTGEAIAAAGDGTVEVPVDVERGVPGEVRRARVGSIDFDFTVAEPGWTMYMISHFHYDPVWWNTQAAYTSVWTEDPPGRCRQTHSFDLVAAIFGEMSAVSRIIYVLVGLSALWQLVPFFRSLSAGEVRAERGSVSHH